MIFSNEIQCWCFIDQNFTRGVLLIFHLPFGVFLMRRNCPLSRISQNSTDNFLSLIFWADLIFFLLETLVIFFLYFQFSGMFIVDGPQKVPKKCNSITKLLGVQLFTVNSIYWFSKFTCLDMVSVFSINTSTKKSL